MKHQSPTNPESSAAGPVDPRTRPVSSQGDKPKFLVRFPTQQMRELVSLVANRNHRSMNAEIIVRLQETLDREQASQDDADELAGKDDSEVFKDDLTPIEMRLIVFFRRLNTRKKQALLTLFS